MRILDRPLPRRVSTRRLAQTGLSCVSMLPDSTGELCKSYMELDPIYFWTATINGWKHLLNPDSYKEEIIGSLRTLSDRGKIDVFGFVIMPNHIHLIWRIKALNGKETPQGSLLKFTAHQFKRMLIEDGGYAALRPFAVNAHNKSYEFWQRDSLAIPLFTRFVAFQKLTYMHNNPLAERWQLALSAERISIHQPVIMQRVYMTLAFCKTWVMSF